MIPRNAKRGGIAAAILIAFVYGTFACAMLLRTAAANAREERAEKAGIYAEQSTAMDGVVVRRVRDRSNGVVCYVASRTINEPYNARPMIATTASISCIQEAR